MPDNRNKKKIITFGKEYELSVKLNLVGSNKGEDGSGPSEVITPPFTSVFEAIAFEYILFKIYGYSLFEYYVRRLENRTSEEKGCHFHYSIMYSLDKDDVDFEEIFRFYYIHAPLFLLCRKLLTLGMRFRNSVGRWCVKFVKNIELISDLEDYEGRSYAFLTPNRNRKDTLTFELRASEGSIALDLCALALVHGIALVLANETKIDLAKWRKYCLWIDSHFVYNSKLIDLNAMIRAVSSEGRSFDEYDYAEYKLHIYLLSRRPVELSLPTPTDDPSCNILEDLATLIPLEEVTVEGVEGLKLYKVQKNTFKHLVPVAQRGWERYGVEHYENAREFIQLLTHFQMNYVNFGATRECFMKNMHNLAFNSLKHKQDEILLKAAKWLVLD